MTDAADLKHKFWKSFSDSPFLFLQRDADPDSAVPMTAQLDKDADSAIWFFTRKDHAFAAGGPATATFIGKDHQMFARFRGVLTTETSRERLEKQWNRVAEVWFPEGKDDPGLLMLRMDLGRAELWNSDLGLIDNARMLMGFDTRKDAAQEHIETTL